MATNNNELIWQAACNATLLSISATMKKVSEEKFTDNEVINSSIKGAFAILSQDIVSYPHPSIPKELI